MIWASLVAQRVKCLLAMLETRVRSPGREDPLEKEMATPVLSPRKFHERRSLVGYTVHGGLRKSHTTEQLDLNDYSFRDSPF